ncbi:MAG: hydrogenase expression/formation protein HypE [Sedimentisphaerales bacterium]|nr:hydrogenase expression/formation protein HypE [Sedimentisphaerales bacterium]
MRKLKRNKVLLAHGGGGRLSDELIRHNIQPRFKDSISRLYDSAELNINGQSILFTTDSYVIKPLFFNGGDIGRLAVCGTVNDLAVAGSKPVALSLSLIIEEGFDFELLEKILDSLSTSAKENNVSVITGDTKTVEAGAADKIFINTAGIGVKVANPLPGFDRISVGDKVLINGTIGDHGLTILSQREGMKFESELKSDCAGLAELTCKLFQNIPGIKFMRDPTRGGLAATLNEIAKETKLSIIIKENAISVKPAAQMAADMLGLDVLNIANEGKFVAFVSEDAADECLKMCKEHPLGTDASLIGELVQTYNLPVVELETKIGGKRIVQMPYGRELPRIC